MPIETARFGMIARSFVMTALLATAACTSNESQPSAQQDSELGNEQGNEVIHELAGTRWALQQLDGKPVTISEGGREAYLYLNSADGSVVGHAGCNRISTTYKQNGAQIGFGDVIATRMFCADMTTETALLQALKVATGWRIEGSRLDLLDGQQKTVARFEARNL